MSNKDSGHCSGLFDNSFCLTILFFSLEENLLKCSLSNVVERNFLQRLFSDIVSLCVGCCGSSNTGRGLMFLDRFELLVDFLTFCFFFLFPHCFL